MSRAHDGKHTQERFVKRPRPEHNSADAAATSAVTTGPRTFPAVRGNWPVRVALNLTLDDEDIQAVCTHVGDTVRKCLHDRPLVQPHVTPTPPDLVHISLSRTVATRLPMIAPLADALRASLARVRACQVTLDGMVLLTNEADTRRFVAVRARARGGALTQLVDAVDEVFRRFNLPPYYSDRIFHATLCTYPTTSTLEAVGKGGSHDVGGGGCGGRSEMAAGTPQTLTVSDEIRAQEEVASVTARPVRALKPNDEDVLTEEHLKEIEAQFSKACDDHVMETTVDAPSVTLTAGDKSFTFWLQQPNL
eukprot:m.102540 g.102540  ORF g.102540 m.102540 type:complete len:306 (+) comp10440_c0_seq1:3-920(+)